MTIFTIFPALAYPDRSGFDLKPTVVVAVVVVIVVYASQVDSLAAEFELEFFDSRIF